MVNVALFALKIISRNSDCEATGLNINIYIPGKFVGGNEKASPKAKFFAKAWPQCKIVPILWEYFRRSGKHCPLTLSKFWFYRSKSHLFSSIQQKRNIKNYTLYSD